MNRNRVRSDIDHDTGRTQIPANMSVDRVERRRLELERADVTTGTVGSEDSTLVNCRTSGRVARIDCRAAGKERDRRGGTAMIAKWTELGIGVIQTASRGKVATAIRADVVTGISENAKAVTS